MKTVLERASAYLSRMPVSVSRQGGHTAAFRAAVALVRGFDLPEQEALPLLCRWNEGCRPPWRENVLRQKLRSAATTATRPAGYLLEAPQPSRNGKSFSSSSSRSGNRGPQGGQGTQGAERSHTACSSTLSSASPQSHTPPPAAPPAEDRAWLRETWPEFHPLSREDIRAVSKLRGLLPDAVDLAHRHGFLRIAQVQDQRCLVITEGTFAQVRRLDGGALHNAAGDRIKARNLSGSQGAFIGQGWLGETTHVLLVEGAVGLIEGLAAMLLVDTPHAWSVLAATSASSRFARDPGLMQRLHGRQVHVVPDNDASGRDAAASWLADLQAAGVCATAHVLPAPCKDLGDVFHLPETERTQILNHLFLP